MNNKEMKQQIDQFVRQHFYLDDATPLPSDASLLAQGVVDSTGIRDVVLFLEQTFSVAIDDIEMTPENLDTINGMVRLIEQKTSSGPAQRG